MTNLSMSISLTKACSLHPARAPLFRPAGLRTGSPKRLRKVRSVATTKDDARSHFVQRSMERVRIAEEEVDLSQLRRIFVRRWPLLCVGLAAGVVLAIIYLHIATYRYGISLQVTPANVRQSNVPGQLGSLATLAGIDLNSDKDQPFQLYLHSLTTRQTADLLAKDDSLMHQVFAKYWDARAGHWIPPTGLATMLRVVLARIVGVPVNPWHAPDGETLQKLLGKELRIEQSKTSSVVTISIDMADPTLGRALLWRLHLQADEILRDRTLQRTSQYIAYLQDKLQTVNVADYRLTLFELLSEQEKSRMVASSTLPFAAEPFGPPVASASPVSPQPLIVIAIMAALGAAAAILLAIMLDSRNSPDV